MELIAGEGTTQTEYKENGCRFAVDVEKAFFSPRLSTERSRIAGLVLEGQTLLNMFAGVGMFSILAASKCKCTTYSIDLNPIASFLCEQSIRMNKLAGEVISINGDVSKVIHEQNLADCSDHTLMLLPERSDEFLDDAIYATKSGGIITKRSCGAAMHKACSIKQRLESKLVRAVFRHADAFCIYFMRRISNPRKSGVSDINERWSKACSMSEILESHNSV